MEDNLETLVNSITTLDTFITKSLADVTSIFGNLMDNKNLRPQLREIELTDTSDGHTISFWDLIMHVRRDTHRANEQYVQLIQNFVITVEEEFLLCGEDMDLKEFQPELVILLDSLGIVIDPGVSNAVKIENPGYINKIHEYQKLCEDLQRKTIRNSQNLTLIQKRIA